MKTPYWLPRAIVAVLVLLSVLYFFFPTVFQFAFSYGKLLCVMVFNDQKYFEEAERLSWIHEYKLHEMEMQFNSKVCESNPPANKKVAWLTAMMNDNYVVGSVYLAYAIKKLSCHHKMIALVSDGVTRKSQEALRTAGFDVRQVEALDCDWMDRRKGMQERHLGLPGTHMRFHAWNYTEYDSIIYLDPDVMPLHNIDELFSLETELAASNCARPGILDPCFNAGLLMFKPLRKSYNEIMNMWSESSVGKACPNDQVLLWHYYADNNRWKSLPYSYNVRRHLYHPMKVYHFACCLTKKPWKMPRPSKLKIKSFKGPLVSELDMVLLWWKHFENALKEFELTEWYENVKNDI